MYTHCNKSTKKINKSNEKLFCRENRGNILLISKEKISWKIKFMLNEKKTKISIAPCVVNFFEFSCLHNTHIDTNLWVIFIFYSNIQIYGLFRISNKQSRIHFFRWHFFFCYLGSWISFRFLPVNKFNVAWHWFWRYDWNLK